MNTTEQQPLSLSQISVNIRALKCDELSNDEMFDCRHDFIISDDQSAAEILLIFTNLRKLNSDNPAGLRRQVTVQIVCDSDATILASATARVYIPRSKLTTTIHISLHFDSSNIVYDQTYKIIVTDSSTGSHLGEMPVRFFPRYFHGCHVAEWLKPTSGGVIPDHGGYSVKSFEATCFTNHTIQFHLIPSIEKLPAILPEMEVRVHHPDLSVESLFCTPKCGDFDDAYQGDTYLVEKPFFMKPDKRGICYAELICLDYPIAGFVFATDSDLCLGPWYADEIECLDQYSPEAATARFNSQINGDNKLEDDPFEAALEQFINNDNEDDDHPDIQHPDIQEPDIRATSLLPSLDHLTGLCSVKHKLLDYEKTVQFNRLRLNNGLPQLTMPLHAMFLGSPGTGKTTVAKMMGVMMRRAGMLSRGHVVIKERANLLGPNYSMEEANTLKAIEEAQGGILLIDEAYQLCQPNDPRDPGKFVIEALMTALADEKRRDWMLILAGYPDEMKRMFDINPGLRSRIPDSNIYVFEDFSEDELMEVATRYLQSHSFLLTDKAHGALSRRLSSDYAARDKTFGNARHVINLIQTEILPAMASRVVSSPHICTDDLQMILADDIPAPLLNLQTARPQIGYRA